MSDFFKYVCVCALACLGLLAYALAVFMAMWIVLPPDRYPDLGIQAHSFAAMVRESAPEAALLALLTCPLFGLSIMRTANGACEKPGDERSWWRHAHRAFGVNLLAASAAGLLVTGIVVAWSVLEGGLREIGLHLGRGIYLGAAVGPVMVALGATIRAFAGASDESDDAA